MVRLRWGAVVATLVLGAACSGGSPSFAGETDALEGAFRSDDGGDLDDEAARCAAESLVAILDPEALGELDGSDDILDADLDELGLDPDDGDDAADVAEVFEDCDADLDDVDADDLRGLAGEATEVALLDVYALALRSVLESDDLVDDDAGRRELRCVGRGIVTATGLDAFADAGPPDEVEDADAVADLELELDSPEELVEALEECDLDLLSIGQDVLSEGLFLPFEGGDCLAEELGEDAVRELGAAGLVLGVEDAAFELGADFDSDVFEAFDACAEELGEFDEDFDVPDATDQEYIESLTSALLEDPVPAEPELASCLAATWVRELGDGFFSEVLLVEPFEVAVLDELGEVGLLEEDVDLLLDAADTCAVAVPGLALALLDTPALTAEQITCFLAVVADRATAADFVTGHLTQELEADDPANVAVAAAMSGCGIAG